MLSLADLSLADLSLADLSLAETYPKDNINIVLNTP